jgi:glycosyltransferase involved in cell wall biosynthesis
LRVLIVSGIWPPDVGGPASHAPELAGFLQRRGHEVEVVTTAPRAPVPESYPVRWTSRRIPVGLRHLASAATIGRRARAAEVVYSTGMYGRCALGTWLARTPLVLKLTSDPAHERSVRYELHDAGLEEFQRVRGVRIALLRRMRNLALRRATHIVCPSSWLRELSLRWGVPPEKVTVLPNPVSPPDRLADREELRRRHGLEGSTLVFAGRLTAQKSLDVGLEALALSEGVTLLIAGDGPDRQDLERHAAKLALDGRVRFLGACSRETVFELLRAADAAFLPSRWENFPHMVVEALAVGTPVLATRAGGVAEIVTDGQNGLLVPSGQPDALADAIARYFGDEELRARLRAGATRSVEGYTPEAIYGRLEDILREAAQALRPE